MRFLTIVHCTDVFTASIRARKSLPAQRTLEGIFTSMNRLMEMQLFAGGKGLHTVVDYAYVRLFAGVTPHMLFADVKPRVCLGFGGGRKAFVAAL